ncbi:MAG: shikimate dehydrogenase [Rhizomicrobium sp.]
MKLTGAGKIGGVAGYPIAHSLSPLLHGFWLEEYGIDGAYVPLKIAPEDFPTTVDSLKAAGFVGINVTVPHKETAFTLADKVSPMAKIAGAANLLIFSESGILADNTDAPGLIATLDAALGQGALRGQKVVIWGAGGMARAAVLALSQMAVGEIVLLARRPENAAALADSMKRDCGCELVSGGFEAWAKAASDSALLINATSAGMSGRPAIDLDLAALPPHAGVFDAVYNPLITPLLAAAAAGQRQTIDGLWLLLHQAVPTFEAMFGLRPQISPALRAVLEKTLHGK